jgi:hypothetical protein
LAIVARIAALSIATAVLGLGVAAGGSSATRVRDLEAWARSPWNPPVGVTTHGYIHPLRVAKHVPAGMYRISILATEALGFELIGPGINRRTKTSWPSRFRSVLAERVCPREHLLEGAAQPRHLQVPGGRARGDRVAPTPYVRLFSGALSLTESQHAPSWRGAARVPGAAVWCARPLPISH